MSAALDRFRASYAGAARRHVDDPGEAALQEAYELGRRAVRDELSVLDLAEVHDGVLGDLLRERGDADPVLVASAAGDVFRESLSAFEMVQRGYREARETVALQRRQAQMVRRLSSFLADASLALDASESFEELLHLVAEQARELAGADCCVMTLQPSAEHEVVRAVTCEGGGEARWAALAAALEQAAAAGDGAVPWRLDAAGLRDHPALAGPGGAPPDEIPRGGLAAPLTALDGRALGALHVFDKREGTFSDVDEAVVVNLAQMASAAVERALLHRARTDA